MASTTNTLQRLDLQVKEQSEALIVLKHSETELISKCEILSDFKKNSEQEIKKKNKLLDTAQHNTKKAIQEADESKYQHQDLEI